MISEQERLAEANIAARNILREAQAEAEDEGFLLGLLGCGGSM
jgi:hypothetical protein